MSKVQIKNEIKYRMALSLLNKLLKQGLITEEQFKKTNRLNALCYKPAFPII